MGNEISGIPGVRFTCVRHWSDERGVVTEVARASEGPYSFHQIIRSFSRRRTLRGLHYHRRQSDLWFLEEGVIRVALVDLRNSELVGPIVFDWEAEQSRSLMIPPGVAHGYVALTDVHLVYCLSHEFDTTDEGGILWNDPVLGISWRVKDPILSERDRSNPTIDKVDLPVAAQR